jgi:predicted enzyme related to lactoylglutathione lyase
LESRRRSFLKSANVAAVLFVKDLQKVTAFYSAVLGLKPIHSDADHSVLNCRGFELVVHQIPKHIADEITIAQPPERRVWGAIRLDYPVRNIEESRRVAQSFGGDVDGAPPEWADRSANFFLAYDPEGNQIGISQHAR